MSAIRSRNTKLEAGFLRWLSAKVYPKGLRYRKNSTNHFGKPDIVFVSKKVAIFLDSCFWHGCQRHYKPPTTNKKYWAEKISRNKKRDAAVNREYRKMGWLVMRVWEHELKKDGEKVASRIASTVGKSESPVKKRVKK